MPHIFQYKTSPFHAKLFPITVLLKFLKTAMPQWLENYYTYVVI